MVVDVAACASNSCPFYGDHEFGMDYCKLAEVLDGNIDLFRHCGNYGQPPPAECPLRSDVVAVRLKEDSRGSK